VLDARARGTTFHEVPVKAILNSPATTGMGFWSLNPYVGCEFGCTYCYARETHKWVMEKAGGEAHRRTGGQADSESEAMDGFSSEAKAASESLAACPPARLPLSPPGRVRQILVKARRPVSPDAVPRQAQGCVAGDRDRD
jgi:hypothetical protein